MFQIIVNTFIFLQNFKKCKKWSQRENEGIRQSRKKSRVIFWENVISLSQAWKAYTLGIVDEI